MGRIVVDIPEDLNKALENYKQDNEFSSKEKAILSLMVYALRNIKR